MQLIKTLAVAAALAVATQSTDVQAGYNYGKVKTRVFKQKVCIDNTPGQRPSPEDLAQFDGAVRVAGQFVRTCPDCIDSHKTIVYRRLSELPETESFGALILDTWSSENNVLGEDFELYSSVQDAKKQVNQWTFCNYDDAGIGFPRDCGPMGKVDMQWNSFQDSRSQKNVRFCTL